MMKCYKKLFSPFLVFLLLLLFTAHPSVHAQSGLPEQEFDWVKSINNGSKYQNIRISSMVDKDGYVYVTGVLYSDLYYDVSNLLLTKIGWQSTFVMKIADDASVVWAKQLGGQSSSSQSRGMNVSVDDAGNVYIAGQFHDIIDFDPDATATHTVTSSGIWDGYLCKLDANGDFVWARTWGKTSGRDFVDHVALTSSGDVYVTGTFSDSLLDLNPGSGQDMAYATAVNTSGASAGKAATERFVCKFDAAGNYQWGQHFQEGTIFNGDAINSLGFVTDTSGNIYIGGSFSSGNRLAFPAGSGMTTLQSQGGYDRYLIKIGASGNFVWAKGFGGSGMDNIARMAADDKDNLYITGAFGMTTDLDPSMGGQRFMSTGGSSYYDIFVLKINTDGDYIWAKTFGGDNHDNGLAIAVDRQGGVYATGSFKDSVNFVAGSSLPEDNITSVGEYDIFVVKFDENGDYEWSKSMGSTNDNTTGGTGPDAGDGISVDPFGNVYVTGMFRDTADFNPGGAVKAELDANDGNMFLLKYAGSCSDSVLTAIETSSCDSYTFGGKTYDSSGVYRKVFATAAGCDSVVTLYLTITPITHPVINVNGFVLGVTPPSYYATYQWILNGTAIPGATNDTYQVQANGDYQVAVSSRDSCVDTSDIYKINNYDAGIEGAAGLSQQVSIYPNPTTDKVYITSPVAVDVTVNSLDGRTLLNTQNTTAVSLGKLASGVYFLRITTRDGQLIKVEKVVKQ